MSFRKLWIAFGLVVLLSFAVLGWTGVRIYQSMPPVPDRVVTSDGTEVIGAGEIHDVLVYLAAETVGDRARCPR